ncbi:hypothetical protein [Cellulomonas edaphi]|uniref:DUF4185 domain-containing protein n=1 Tax=Cellulomonas edaphi TaxID=3053468 RepID=A0ABT7S2P1_9CELL|nr:hypothetical protein [Cellulomons edaphi]MDM7829881.1 hypothetical protein [Cellulomons edaphi]
MDLHIIGTNDDGPVTNSGPFPIYTPESSNVPWRIAMTDDRRTWDARHAMPAVGGVAWDGPDITAMAATSTYDPEVHTFALVAGNLWHSRNLGGFAHVHGPNNEGIGDFTHVAAAGDRSRVHVVGLIKGNVWHGIWDPGPDGTRDEWTGFNHLHGPNNEPHGRELVDVACAVAGSTVHEPTGPGGDLHVVAVLRGSTVWHNIRYPDGSWQGFNRFVLPANIPYEVRWVRVAGTFRGDLHCVFYLEGGTGPGLWHTIRFNDGTWQDVRRLCRVELRALCCTSDGYRLFVVGMAPAAITRTEPNDRFYYLSSRFLATYRDDGREAPWHPLGIQAEPSPFASIGFVQHAYDHEPPVPFEGLVCAAHTLL